MSAEQSIAVTYGIDLGKSWFHVVGLDAEGSPVKKRLSWQCHERRFLEFWILIKLYIFKPQIALLLIYQTRHFL